MDIRDALQRLSEPWGRGDKIKCAINRSAQLSGFSYSRTFEIWYGRAKVTAEEVARISEALEIKNRKDARNELSELRLRLARLESLLVQTDPDFHRSTIDLVGQQMRRSR